MVWSPGGVLQNLAFMGMDDVNKPKVNPQKVIPGSLFALAKTNILEPPSQEVQSAERLKNGYDSLGVVNDISKDQFNSGPSDYLERAEDLMFRANQVANQAAQVRLQRSVPVFKSGGTQVNISRSGSVAGPKGKGELARFINAVSGKESGGRYGAVNPDSGALGKYQIMPGNLAGPGGWDKQILGRNISTSQFLHSPQLQEKIGQGMLTQYYKKYGAAGAASAWYSGSPTKWKTGGHGSQGAYPTIYNYVQSILRAMR